MSTTFPGAGNQERILHQQRLRDAATGRIAQRIDVRHIRHRPAGYTLGDDRWYGTIRRRGDGRPTPVTARRERLQGAGRGKHALVWQERTPYAPAPNASGAITFRHAGGTIETLQLRRARSNAVKPCSICGDQIPAASGYGVAAGFRACAYCLEEHRAWR
jgi:hypothetical protein